eukprot:TRINITY_DN18852_c0_g1_i1.p1 TRINITY_DN18852_c0_g1~~TRINITY_DN18852_c0_g1_i1.p1  ORF type:complete len:145 (+),score=38.47 TRINITY_DN18852_c0_g1_i1:169-603(+)
MLRSLVGSEMCIRDRYEIRRLIQLREEQAEAATAARAQAAVANRHLSVMSSSLPSDSEYVRGDVESVIVQRRRHYDGTVGNSTARQKWKFKRVGDLSKSDQLWLQLKPVLVFYLLFIHSLFVWAYFSGYLNKETLSHIGFDDRV